MPPVSLRRTPLIVLLLAALLVALGSWAFYTSDAATKARAREDRLADTRTAAASEVGPTLEVSVLPATRRESEQVIELSGVLEAVRSTWVAAERAGRIREVPAHEHAPIEAGGLLVRLDASLARAESIRAEAAHRLAKSELERQERLGSRSVASEAELERAVAEERRSYAALLEARTRLDYTRITAPFDGIVNSLELDPGAYVQPGTRIAEILDVSRLEIPLLVSDRQVHSIRPGMPVRVRIDALGSERREARVARVGRATQSTSQRYPVIVELENTAPTPTGPGHAQDSPGRLRPGMLAHVLFSVGTTPAIRLPVRAVIHEFELDYVFVLDAQDRVRRVRVSTRPVPFRPDQIDIAEGLTEGDRVVVTAVSQLRDGLRVRVR